MGLVGLYALERRPTSVCAGETKMPNVTFNVEVYCAECGNGLCQQTESTHTKSRGEPCFRVTPCQVCMGKADDAAYDRGYNDGGTV